MSAVGDARKRLREATLRPSDMATAATAVASLLTRLPAEHVEIDAVRGVLVRARSLPGFEMWRHELGGPRAEHGAGVMCAATVCGGVPFKVWVKEGAGA